MKKDSKRAIILEAAMRVLGTKSIEKTTVSDIVKEAGVAQGTFYLYFPSKTAIIPAIAEQLIIRQFEQIAIRAAETDEIWEKLHQFIKVTFDETYVYKDLLALCYSGLAIEDAMEEWERIYEPYYVWLSKLLEEGKERGEVRKTVDARVAAKLIVGLVEHAAEQAYLFDEEYATPDAYELEVWQMIVHSFKASK